MARPLRIEYPGAVYHLTSRGNERKAIFRADADREAFLAFLGKVVHRFGWRLSAWVLMSNHFHLVIQTPEPNLSRGMHWLNGSYAGWFNHGHKRWGHLFGGRFKAFIIEKDAYFHRGAPVCRPQPRAGEDGGRARDEPLAELSGHRGTRCPARMARHAGGAEPFQRTLRGGVGELSDVR